MIEERPLPSSSSSTAWQAAGLPAAILLPTVIAGVFSLWAFWSEGHNVPAAEDYQAAAATLDAKWTEGDLLTVLPAWSLRPFEFIRGRERITGDAVVNAPLHRARRLIVVAEPDSERTVAELTSRLGPPAALLDRPRLRVLAFNVYSGGVAHDFRADLSAASVSLTTSKGDVLCPPSHHVFQCAGRKNWQRVEREFVLVTENSADAIWAHPPPRGETLRLQWNAIPLGDAVVVRGGFDRDGSSKAQAPVRINIVATTEAGDSVEVGSITFPVAFAYRTTRLPMPPAVRGQQATLTFEVSSSNNSSANFAFDAMTVFGERGPADAPIHEQTP